MKTSIFVCDNVSDYSKDLYVITRQSMLKRTDTVYVCTNAFQTEAIKKKLSHFDVD